MERESVDSTPPTARAIPSVFGIVLIFVAIVSVVTYVRTLYRLRHFKGPFLAVTSKLWMLKCCYHKDTHWELKKLCDKYGKSSKTGLSDFVPLPVLLRTRSIVLIAL